MRVKPATAPSSCLSRFETGEERGILGRLHPPGAARIGGRDSSGEVMLGRFSAAVPAGKGSAAAGLRGGFSAGRCWGHAGHWQMSWASAARNKV